MWNGGRQGKQQASDKMGGDNEKVIKLKSRTVDYFNIFL